MRAGTFEIRTSIRRHFRLPSLKESLVSFTHEGELVLDPFVGSGTTLVAARNLNRSAIGFDLQEKYIDLCVERLSSNNLFNRAQQLAIQDDARNIPTYLDPETVSLIWTFPPYANLENVSTSRDETNAMNSLAGSSNIRKTHAMWALCRLKSTPRPWGTSLKHYCLCYDSRGIVLSTSLICGGTISVSRFMSPSLKSCERGGMNSGTSSFGTEPIL